MLRIVIDEYQIPRLEDKTTVIPNPVDTSIFHPDIRELISKKNRSLSVLYAGRLEYRKGVHVLAQAIPMIRKELRDVRFIFIGSDTPTAPDGRSMRAYLNRQIESYQEVVELINPLPQHQLAVRYASSSVVVVPSLQEPFGLTCAEAMACGACVVASRVGGLVEIVQDGQTGYLVEPNNPHELALAINELLAHPEERLRVGRNARKAIIEQMSSERITSKKISHYQQVLA
jgi:glycosyltransferase involved in cell wall biosynthesis